MSSHKTWFPLTNHHVFCIVIGALCGVLLTSFWSCTPIFFAVCIVLGAVITHPKWHRLRRSIVCFSLSGLLLSSHAFWQYHQLKQLFQQIPDKWKGTISGQVIDRSCEDDRCRWTLKTSNLNQPQSQPVLIVAYTPAIDCAKDSQLNLLNATVKKIHPLFNFGQPNRLTQALIKTQVASASTSTRPSCEFRPPSMISTIQSTLATHITPERYQNHGIIKALTLGDKSDMTQEHWQLLRQTGTSHLMAISGLHVGLLFLCVFWFTERLLKTIGLGIARVPSALGAKAAALLFAFAYALISGWQIPVQRATLMLTMMTTLQLHRLPNALWLGYGLALFLILLCQPFSVLSAGFWLSFGAVFFLLLWQPQEMESRWKQALACQLLLSIALIPLSVWWFGGFSSVSPLANLIAIPWMSFGVVPLALAGTVLAVIMPWLGQILLVLSDWQLSMVLQMLNGFAKLPHAYIPHQATKLGILLAVIGSVVMILPIPWHGRRMMIAVLLWCPFWWQPLTPPVPKGAVQITMLDVGQGLSILLKTARHSVLYDTGLKNRYVDRGAEVVVPAVAYHGIQTLDRILISHADLDHSGGLTSVLPIYTTRSLVTSEPATIPGSLSCYQGQTWHYDGVDFEILHPSEPWHGKRNDGSCVLLVTVGKYRVLLTGDIEAPTETLLLENGIQPVDIVMVPHHGSHSSSTEAFLRKLKPNQAWNSVGHLNVYHHPRPVVTKRYQSLDIPLFHTSQTGAITLMIQDSKSLAWPHFAKQLRWWQQ